MTQVVEQDLDQSIAGGEKRELIKDLSYLFKIIDCKLLFIKEYYIQLPFILMRFIFALAQNNEMIVG
jgi:hypothetical protein